MVKLNSTSALKQIPDLNPQPIDILPLNLSAARPLLAAEQIQKLEQFLRFFTNNSFYDDCWNVSIEVSHQHAKIQFPLTVEQTDKQILKAAVLKSLLEYGSCKHAKRLLSDGTTIFAFLSSHNITIENTHTATIDLFISHLENISKSNGQKNSVIRSYIFLFDVCVEFGFTDVNADKRIDFSFRFGEKKTPKRAPDAVVSDAVTRLIFDLTYPMPLAYRTIFMILRLIPKRISEVLSMDVDCISYPAEGVFAITIATQKETNHHIPEEHKYYFQMSGTVEQLLYAVIKLQQKNSQRDNTIPVNHNYLFYSCDKKRLITTADVNTYLQLLIEENQICDNAGNIGTMTSHDFRHISIVERLRHHIFTVEQIRLEANHHTINQTLAYGYQSLHDEAKHLQTITSEIFDWKKRAAEENCTPEEIAPKKYARIEALPYTRIIPCYGLCMNQNCTPQYEQCIYCEHYNPNPIFLEYFQATKLLLENKRASLEEKLGDPKAVKVISQHLKTITRFVELLEKPNIDRKEA